MWRKRQGLPGRKVDVERDSVQGGSFGATEALSSRFQPRAEQPISPLVAPAVEDGPQLLIGHRIIRLLGRGSRATVYLGHRVDAAVPAHAGVDINTLGPSIARNAHPSLRHADFEVGDLVALKMLHSAVEPSSIDLEVRVLTEVANPHVLGLNDIGTSPGGGVVLVLPHLAGGTLRQLLDRRLLQPGEAVNILVPIITAVLGLFENGFWHRSLTSSRVMFDSRGTPVLAGMGRVAQLGAGTGPIEARRHREESEIWESVVALSAEVLERVPGGRSDERWLGLKVRLSQSTPDPILLRVAEELIARLFEWAHPCAVADSGPEKDRSTAASSRIPGRTHRFTGEGSDPAEPDNAPFRRSWLAVLHLPAELRQLSERALDQSPVRAVKDAWRTVPGRARRMLVIGGLVFAVLATALLLATPNDNNALDPRGDGVGTVGYELGTSTLRPATTTPKRAISHEAATGEGEWSIGEGEQAIVQGDDPLAAVEVLFAARQRCLQQESLVCLHDVVQDDTALMAADRARLGDHSVGASRDGDATPSPGPQTHRARLVERSGDAALIQWEPQAAKESQPVSVLLLRTETGWRLREIFDF
ncbi:protein kinase family protein [Homoserinimonas sp. OAct 916]|uniref:protein kinase family protein n=1 Tax=Homoserinimonas sp. OAct 916 TaxID=2211450 RepID=UPI000DBE398F|nr:protein kinase family protein [Homoserinimonas sp. OAct 916]